MHITRPKPVVHSFDRSIRSRRTQVALFSAILLSGACHSSTAPIQSAPDMDYPAGSLEALMEPVRRRANLPALAAAVVRDGKLTEIAAVGVRRAGDTTRVTTEDRWHLGSITKSVTGSVAARLVDRGSLRWETTIGDALPTLAAAARPEWRTVTLAQLLTMRAGVRDDALDRQWNTILGNRSLPAVEQRRAAARMLLATTPAAADQWSYSNASVALAGHLMEEVVGRPWEQLVREEVFTPLGLASGGFGAPASPGRLDAPWGHAVNGKRFTPVPPGPDADNPAAIGPAATVHLSLRDLATYAIAHLASERGATDWLSASNGTRIHTSAGRAFADTTQFPANGYAMGWLIWRDAASGNVPILMHDGSNRSFYALVWLVPSRNLAFVIVTNAGDEVAGTALNDVLQALLRRN